MLPHPITMTDNHESDRYPDVVLCKAQDQNSSGSSAATRDNNGNLRYDMSKPYDSTVISEDMDRCQSADKPRITNSVEDNLRTSTNMSHHQDRTSSCLHSQHQKQKQPVWESEDRYYDEDVESMDDDDDDVSDDNEGFDNEEDDINIRRKTTYNRESSLERPRRSRLARNPFLPERHRLKRQTLQNMARPLKRWLVKHKANPYPTKSEKAKLASGSNMTMIQVSNWFANARRRLKNTVKVPDANTWHQRIKLYNSCIEGNAEKLSDVEEEGSSVFSEADDDPIPPTNTTRDVIPSISSSEQHLPRDEGDVNDFVPCQKYKSGILQRYLNDACAHNVIDVRQRHNSGSLGSRDSGEMSDYSAGHPCNSDESFDENFASDDALGRISGEEKNDLYWKEISAALALTSLARSQRVTFY